MVAAGNTPTGPSHARIALLWVSIVGGSAHARRMSHSELSELLSFRGTPDIDKICVVVAFTGGCTHNRNQSPKFIKDWKSVSIAQKSAFRIYGQFQHVYEALVHRELPAKAGTGIDSAYWCVTPLNDDAGTAFIKVIKKKISRLAWAEAIAGLLGGFDAAGTIASHVAQGPAAVIASDTLGHLGPVGSAIALMLTNPTAYNIEALAAKIMEADKTKNIAAYFTQWTKEDVVQNCIKIHRIEPCGRGPSSRCFVLGEGKGALKVTTKVLAYLTALLVAAPDGQHYSDDMMDDETRARIQAESSRSANSSHADRAL